MIGLVRLIIILIVIYFIIRFITRIILPLFIGNYINKKVSQAQNNYRKDNSRHKEGDVIINNTANGDKKYKVNEGEYVDFEEIKE